MQNHDVALKMIVHAVQLFITVVQQFNQGLCRNMGVICFGLTFWFFCVKTKEQALELKGNEAANSKHIYKCSLLEICFSYRYTLRLTHINQLITAMIVTKYGMFRCKIKIGFS